jgi:putative transposase
LSESPSSKETDVKKSRFTEAQIIGVLREQEAGSPTGEVCRRHGISDQTFYRWKAKYSGMSVSDAQKLRTLEDENRRLKKLLAESMLDVSALKDLLGKCMVRPVPARLLTAARKQSA